MHRIFCYFFQLNGENLATVDFPCDVDLVWQFKAAAEAMIGSLAIMYYRK